MSAQFKRKFHGYGFRFSYTPNVCVGSPQRRCIPPLKHSPFTGCVANESPVSTFLNSLFIVTVTALREDKTHTKHIQFIRKCSWHRNCGHWYFVTAAGYNDYIAYRIIKFQLQRAVTSSKLRTFKYCSSRCRHMDCFKPTPFGVSSLKTLQCCTRSDIAETPSACHRWQQLTLGDDPLSYSLGRLGKHVFGPKKLRSLSFYSEDSWQGTR